jgi:transketolase
LWQNFLKVLYRLRGETKLEGLDRVHTINALDAQGEKQFLHSATYEELVEAFGLTPAAIASAVQRTLKS